MNIVTRIKKCSAIDLAFLMVAVFWLPLFLLNTYTFDDVMAFTANQHRSYFQIITESHGWAGTAFYRPLIDLQTKLIWDVSAGNFFFFKIYQFILFSLFLLLLRNALAKLEVGIGGAILMLALLCSSRAINDAFLWWVNMGQAVVLISFAYVLNCLIACLVSTTETSFAVSFKEKIGLFLFSFLAIFSKEIGLVVLAVALCIAYIRKNISLMLMLAALFPVFIFARLFVIGEIGSNSGFIASGGLGFYFLSSDELRAAFNDNKYIYYLYNFICQLLYSFFKQPVNGQLIAYKGMLYSLSAFVYALSSLILISNIWNEKNKASRKILFFMLGAIFLNSVLSFPYPRERIMVISDVAYAVIAVLIFKSVVDQLRWKTSESSSISLRRYAVLFAVTAMTLIAAARGARFYLLKISNSIVEMRSALVGNYEVMLEGPRPMPEEVGLNVMEFLNYHYYLIIHFIDKF